jgi:CheY-like chemotaxis protein
MTALQVLVVEDDSSIAMPFVETLVETGHGLFGMAATESNAVMAALQSRSDLIIADAQLREGSGISAVDEILWNGFVPHLFISGDTEEVLARQPDAVALNKPFREPELVVASQRALDAPDREFKDRAARFSNDRRYHRTA